MSGRQRLVPTHVPARPSGVVLVIHGGASRRGPSTPVSPAQLSVLRMVPVATRIAVRGRGTLAVFRLLNSYRGWHADHTPVDDAVRALAELHQRFGRLPASLVGHSLGARAALLAGADDSVTSVVALNAYLYPHDANDIALPGRRILFVHGDRDRVAPMDSAEAVAKHLARSANVEFVRVRGGKHAMLGRNRAFDGLAAEFVTSSRDALAPSRPTGVGLHLRTI